MTTRRTAVARVEGAEVSMRELWIALFVCGAAAGAPLRHDEAAFAADGPSPGWRVLR